MVKRAQMLFETFPELGEITKKAKKQNMNRVFTGGVRINKGMYRTTLEEKRYRERLLKRKLP